MESQVWAVLWEAAQFLVFARMAANTWYSTVSMERTHIPDHYSSEQMVFSTAQRGAPFSSCAPTGQIILLCTHLVLSLRMALSPVSSSRLPTACSTVSPMQVANIIVARYFAAVRTVWTSQPCLISIRLPPLRTSSRASTVACMGLLPVA